MKGRVLRWSRELGRGVLIGDDGLQRTFGQADLVETEQAAAGASVIFEAKDGIGEEPGQATQVRLIDPVASTSTSNAAAPLRVIITDLRIPFSTVLRITLQVIAITFVVSLLALVLFGRLR